jgi:pimeloyl-ACP methyl ester carboxylesterase
MLMFLPGLICDARIYAPQTAAFADSMAVDSYGMAASLVDMARIALAEADRAGADQIDLFGHSMGGRVALEVFRLAPHRVRRLALASTGIHPLAPDETGKREGLKAVGHRHGFKALVDHWLPPMVAEANRANPAIYGPLEEMCLSKGQAMFDAQIHALVNRPAVDGLLPRIACPTLVLTGELDTWASPAQHKTIAAAIGPSTLEIQFEAPEAVNSAITRWLQQPAA